MGAAASAEPTPAVAAFVGVAGGVVGCGAPQAGAPFASPDWLRSRVPGWGVPTAPPARRPRRTQATAAHARGR
eukprot:2431698-Lingulodinium_polyedra.AAC.1